MEVPFVFSFDEPVNLREIGLLNNDGVYSIVVLTADGGSYSIVNGNGGRNSYEALPIYKPNVKRVTVWISGYGAITHVETNQCRNIDYLSVH